MKRWKKKLEIPEVPFGKTVIYYNKDALSLSDKIGGAWENYEFTRNYPVWPKVSFYGYRDPEAYCYHHEYPYYALEIVEHGELIVTLHDDVTLTLHDGEGVIFLPNENSSLKVGPMGVCRKGCCIFSGELADTFFAAMGLITDKKLKPENPENIFKLIRRIASLIEKKQPGTEPELCGLGFQLLTQLRDSLPEMHADLFYRAKRLFALSIPRKIEMREIIRELDTNRNTLCRIFREKLGLTPGQYFFELRMQTARELLRNGDLRIGYIAERVGYDDQLAFSHAFRRHFGCSPKEIRSKENSSSAE